MLFTNRAFTPSRLRAFAGNNAPRRICGVTSYAAIPPPRADQRQNPKTPTLRLAA
jgi:hypothetical protein